MISFASRLLGKAKGKRQKAKSRSALLPLPFCLLPFAFCLLLPPLAHAGVALPGGILDSTGRTGYLGTDTGIDAVGLARGELLWRTSRAQVPLLVVADRLYALALSDRNVLYVRGFDLIDKGKQVYQSARIELPGWVVTSGAPGHSFRTHHHRNKSILHLDWQASASADTGPRKEAGGTVRIDLEKGTVTLGKVGPPPLPSAPMVSPQLEKRCVRWQRSISGHLHAVVLEEVVNESPQRKDVATQRASEKRLVLRTWNEKTGKETSRFHELVRGSRPVLLIGVDGFHLWVRDAAPSPDMVGDDLPSRCHWAVYSALDGHLVARVPYLPGTQEATLIGDRAYLLTGTLPRHSRHLSTQRIRLLHAVDVESGKTLWQRPLARH
jgi:hypothetical protein